MNPKIHKIKITKKTESQKNKPNQEASAAIPTMSSEKLSTTTISMEALQASFTRLYHHVHRRPWPELADRSCISMPESLSEVLSRIRKNLYYFRINYLIVVVAMVGAFLITRPLTFFVLATLGGAWIFLYVVRKPERQVVIFGRAFSDREVTLWLSVFTVAAVMVTSVVSAVVSAVAVAVAVVCVHGAVRVPEDMFLEKQQMLPWGFGPFSVGDGRPVSSTGVSVGPTMV